MNGLKQGEAISPLLLSLSLEYAIKNVQERNLGLDLNGTHQVLDHDDVNLIVNDIRTIEGNSYVLLNVCQYVGLAIKQEKLRTWM